MKNDDPDDPVTLYLREIANVQPLTKDEEEDLFRQLGQSENWDEQQKNAERRLIESHLILVVSIAERHAASSGVPVLDLIQEGNLGLFDAVKTFAKEPRGAFSDYAAVLIDDAICKAVAKPK